MQVAENKSLGNFSIITSRDLRSEMICNSLTISAVELEKKNELTMSRNVAHIFLNLNLIKQT
jgi:hypothetical protein